METMEKALPYLGMVGAQFAQVGLIIIGKEAMSSGMTNFTFVSYSNALASLLLLPSLLINRSTRPPLNFSLVCGYFLLGVLGCCAQLTGYAGIYYTSASFSSAMLNLIPGFTFVFAIIFRMERFDCRSKSTLAKSLGTVVSITGAFIATLLKGPRVLMLSMFSKNLVHQHFQSQQSKWVLGGVFLTADCAASSAFVIVQASIMQKCPAEMILVCFYCFFAAILSAAVSLIVETDPSAWALEPSMRLFAVLYSGVIGSALQVCLTSWCVRKKGPLFVAMFHPLGIIIATALGIILQGDVIYLGSFLGSIIIVIGFYAVIWGKGKELMVIEEDLATSSRLIEEKASLLGKVIDI